MMLRKPAGAKLQNVISNKADDRTTNENIKIHITCDIRYPI